MPLYSIVGKVYNNILMVVVFLTEDGFFYDKQ